MSFVFRNNKASTVTRVKHWKTIMVHCLNSQLSFTSVGLVFAFCCVVYFTFLYPLINVFHAEKQMVAPKTDQMANSNRTTTITTLLKEKQILKIDVEMCEAQVKTLVNSLQGEKRNELATSTFEEKLKLCEKQRWVENQETDKMAEKLQEEKKILEANATLYREFFNHVASSLRNVPYTGVEKYIRYSVARLGILPLGNAKPIKPEFGPVINDVLSFNYPIAITPCPENVNQSVFIPVISAPDNFDKRRMIRQTWTKHLMDVCERGHLGSARFAFVLGMTENNVTQGKIEEESKNFGDIIQIEMSDFYRNLPFKMAGLFNWLHKNCAKVDFVFKVDDDVYVNVHNLAQFIHSFYNRSRNTVFGRANWSAPGRGTLRFSQVNSEMKGPCSLSQLLLFCLVV
ncbi:hypothetical protein OUZ56_011081 [Daphnia magna]|uniref:Hexosyltransferase n=1 Tax=Daphnia magna TaxID=35525 RepID=A0ABQ9YZ83_9CRUS|nr:hypothetical protein OUZ56_011081 [Daphnia magna]